MAATTSNYPRVKPENAYLASSSSWHFVDSRLDAAAPPSVSGSGPSRLRLARELTYSGPDILRMSQPIMSPSATRALGSLSSTQPLPMPHVTPRPDPREPMSIMQTWNSIEPLETRGRLDEHTRGNYPLPTPPQNFDVDFKKALPEAPHREASPNHPTYRFFRRSVNRPTPPLPGTTDYGDNYYRPRSLADAEDRNQLKPVTPIDSTLFQLSAGLGANYESHNP